MLETLGRQTAWSGCNGVRRDFLRVGAATALGLSLADWLRLRADAADTTQPAGAASRAKARAVIQLWMNGGPSHLDTFDPKPQAGDDYCGPYKRPIATRVDGMQISQMLPLLAQQADKFAILRAMTHGNNSHETASYIMQSGTLPSDLVYPAMGAVVAYKRQAAGYTGSLPPYMSLTTPLGRFSESGFLGAEYKTFATGGDPDADSVRVQGIVPPAGLSDERLARRRTLLEHVDALTREMDRTRAYREMNEFQQQAYDMILGDAKNAFDMSQETDAMREQYGRHRFGQSCLLARRLVERGVPFITINSGGWDTHRDNFGRLKELLPPLDQGFAALLADLEERGLLESTIVTWYGEFGRTPKIAPEAPWDGGRHHYGPCMSAVVAGGGFTGGTVVGESDAKGEQPKERAVYPWDLTGSIYQLLGIDPTGSLPHPQGCVARVTPAPSEDLESGGLLTEIM